MRTSWRMWVPTSVLLLATGCASAAALDDAALRAYAARPYDKATMMHTTVELGRHHGVSVVAEFPCSDVCPQYTVRIIRYQLPGDVTCESIGGVEREVLIPVAITVRPRNFCFPKVLVDTNQHYVR